MKIKFISKKDIKLLKNAAKYVLPYKQRFFIAIMCVLSGIAFDLLQPIIFSKIITGLFGKDFSKVLHMVTYMIILFLVQTSIGFFRSYIFSSLNEKITFDIKRDMYKKIINLPIKAFDEMRVGEFMSRMNGDAQAITNIITGQFLNSFINVIRVVILGITIFSINIYLSFVTVGVLPISVFIFVFFGHILRKRKQEIIKINDSYFNNIQESISSIREIKNLGIKHLRIKEFLNICNTLKSKNISIGVLSNLSSTSSHIVDFIAEVSIILLGLHFIIKGNLSVEYYIAFSAYSSQFRGSLIELTQLNSSIQQALASIERIFALMNNLNYKTEQYGNMQVNSIEGNISFNNIIFGYQKNQIILNDISFHVKGNSKIAIVGLSGGGKTTIFNLIMRFYEVFSGTITIDGIDIRKFSEESLRNHMAVVRQEAFLFNATIKENMRLTNPDNTEAQIIEACKKAYIHDYIHSLPNGYDTKIGEGGVNFSVGQKQRLAIARSILKDSKIILFDEATSALDNESQYMIKKAVDDLSKTHTVIMIAHRLLTVIDCDDILIIDKGKLYGRGTHKVLINENDVYKRLYKSEIDLLNKGHKEAATCGTQ